MEAQEYTQDNNGCHKTPRRVQLLAELKHRRWRKSRRRQTICVGIDFRKGHLGKLL